MKRKLYSNMRRMTTLFSIAIICVTLSALMLRLTVLGDLAVSGAAGPAVVRVNSELFPYTIARRVNFRTPESRGDFRIENPQSNEYYMSVDVILPETGKTVFYTGFIRPGDRRGQSALHIQLPEGAHEAIARVTAYHPVTFQPRGSEDRSITLYIG